MCIRDSLVTYPVGADEATEDKTYHELHIVTGDARDAVSYTHLDVYKRQLLNRE